MIIPINPAKHSSFVIFLLQPICEHVEKGGGNSQSYLSGGLASQEGFILSNSVVKHLVCFYLLKGLFSIALSLS